MIYEFKCDKCCYITEKYLPINSEKTITICDHCGEETAKRIVSLSNFILKGDNWASKGGY